MNDLESVEFVYFGLEARKLEAEKLPVLISKFGIGYVVNLGVVYDLIFYLLWLFVEINEDLVELFQLFR